MNKQSNDISVNIKNRSRLLPQASTALLLLCLCLFLAGCVSDDYEPETKPVRTVLFYMGGDNNLSGETEKKIERLKNVPVPASCHLIIYSDSRNNSPSLREVGNGKLTVIRQYEESNSADAEVFASVLREVVKLYPAPSYGLVLFSHASGWMPEGTYNNPGLRSLADTRSVIIDNGSEMEIPLFAAAIPNGMFDFIVFEACFMAGVEVAYELKDKTKYIVASSAEIVSPGFMPVYTEAVPLLLKPTADLTGFCRMVEASYRTREPNYDSFSLSLVNTTCLDGVAVALRGAALPSSTDGVQCFDRYGGGLFFDLADSYAYLTDNRLTDLGAAIEASVIWKSATKEFMPTYGGFEIVKHSGLTCYIPQERYPKLNEAYKNLKWYREVFE